MARSSRSLASSLSPRAEYWRRLIAECARSGLTQAEFCRRRHLSPITMSWWRREIRFREGLPPSHGPSIRNGKRRSKAEAHAVRFVPVTIRPSSSAPSAPAAAAFEIALSGGRVIRLGARFDEDVLRRVVATLESIPSPC